MRLKLAAFVAAALFAAAPVHAQTFTNRASAGASQMGLVVTAVQSLTVPPYTSVVVVCAEVQAVRWRDDGIAPTAAVGQPLASGACLQLTGNPATYQFIAQVAGGAIDVSYWR